MRNASLNAVFLGLGLAIGFLLWGTGDDQTERSPYTRHASLEREVKTVVTHSAPETKAPPAAPETKQQPSDGTALTKKKEAEAEAEKPNPIMNFLKAAGPLMKRSAQKNAREQAAELAKMLSLAPHRAKQLEELMVKQALKALEQLRPLFEGGEIDPIAQAEFSENEDGIPVGLERAFATVLNGNELDQVKDHYREEKQRQLEARIESEFKGLALANLTERQSEQLREMLRREITEESKQDGAMPNSAKELADQLSGKGVATKLERKFAARREKLTGFLTLEQLAQVDRANKAELENARASMSLFRGAATVVKPK